MDISSTLRFSWSIGKFWPNIHTYEFTKKKNIYIQIYVSVYLVSSYWQVIFSEICKL